MAALFSCTRCHSRHPFDDLSDGEQLCQRCRNNYPTVKCTYCRAEFQQESKSSTNTICKKCAQNVKAFGKPSACEYCSIPAAFIGKKCQRCTNSEKKWGVPQTCEQCKQKCAFDRTEDSKKKVGGKVLCWLCTLAYKRAVAKAVLKSSGLGSSAQKRSSLDARLEWINTDNSRGGSESRSNPPTEGVLSLSNSGNSGSKDNKSSVPWLNSSSSSSNGGSATDKSAKDKHHHHSSTHHHSHHNHHHQHRDKAKHRHHHSKSKHHHSRRKSAEEEDSPPQKKPKAEVTSTPNGVSTPKSNMPALEGAGLDSAMSDHVIVITQLKEQLEGQKKQLGAKDQQLMEKDKKITELKAQMYEQEKESRARIQLLQKQHDEALQELQGKNRELTKQVKVLSKGKKLPSAVSSPPVL